MPNQASSSASAPLQQLQVAAPPKIRVNTPLVIFNFPSFVMPQYHIHPTQVHHHVVGVPVFECGHSDGGSSVSDGTASEVEEKKSIDEEDDSVAMAVEQDDEDDEEVDSGDETYDEDDDDVKWQVLAGTNQDNPNHWMDMSEESDSDVETGFQGFARHGVNALIYTHGGASYKVDFDSFKQTNLRTNYVRAIRRVAL